MDFNLKQLMGNAGTFLTRAVQVHNQNRQQCRTQKTGNENDILLYFSIN